MPRPLLIKIDTLDHHHRPDVVHVNPEHVIKIYQTPISKGSVGTLICLDTRNDRSPMSKLLTNTALGILVVDLGPFVPVTPANETAIEYIRVQSIVALQTYDYHKPVAERTVGCLHLKDGSSMLVSNRADVAKFIQSLP